VDPADVIVSVNGNTFAEFDSQGLLINAGGGLLPRQIAFSPLEVRDEIDIVSAGVRPLFVLARANGTFGSKTAVLLNDLVGGVTGRGWDTVSYGTLGALNFVANPAGASLTPTDHGGALTFTITPPGGVLVTERMKLTSSGLAIYTTASFLPTSTLDVLGTSGATFRLRDGNQAAGKQLVSIDGNGVAQWQFASLGSLFWSAGVGGSQLYVSPIGNQLVLVPPAAATLGAGQDFTQPVGNPGRLVYTGLLTKNFVVTMTASLAGTNAGDDVYLWPHVNGVSLSNRSARAKSTLAGAFVELSLTMSVQLVTNDYLEIWASNETSANFTLSSLSISATS
jgi:hypothetical protein